MDIENVWRGSRGVDNALDKLLQEQDYGKIQSKLPLKKLKRNLFISIIYAIIITIGYAVLFYKVSIWQVRVAIVLVSIFNVWIIILTWYLFKNTHENIDSTNSLKHEIQKNVSAFQHWWDIQEKAGLFMYPIAIAGGFMLGIVSGSGKSIEVLFHNPKILIVLAITILIFVPLSYYGARWMFNHSYGKHLKKLKLLIDELTV